MGLLVVGFVACKSDSKQASLDLMKHGLPIVIHAPIDAEVMTNDMGFMKDVTVKSGNGYYIQIMSGEAVEIEPKVVAAKLKQIVQSENYFDSIVEQEEEGFIYKKDIDGQEDYDFRYVRISGGKDYVFQTGLIGTFTLEQVKAMYESVKK